MAKKKSWTLGKRITVLCVVLVVISIATGVLGVKGIRTLLHSLNGVATASLPSIKQITTIQALGLEFRGTALLMGTPGLRNDYKSNQVAHLKDLRVQILKRLDAYGASVSPAELPTYQNLRKATMVFVGSVDKFLDLSLHGKSEEAGTFWSVQGGPQSKAFRKALEDEVALNERLTDEFLRSGLSAAYWATTLAWFLLFATAILGAVLGTLMIRSITQSLKRAASDLRATAAQVSSASNQLLSSSTRLAANASQQAAALDETSAEGQRVTGTSRRNAQSCQAAAALMHETEAIVSEANRKLDGTVASMKEITDSSERIARIIKVIDAIAFQTNILALNAAVEAARAGEAGMGFAVVADEVRNLAGRCAEAAKDIAALIDESVANTRTGKNRLDEAALSVRNMAASALKVKTLVREVDTDAQQQTASIHQIASSLYQIQHTTQETAAMAEESAFASAELNTQAGAMEAIVGTLEALV